MKKVLVILIFLFVIGRSWPVSADFQVPNSVIEECSANEQFCFSSTPTSDYGVSGKTVVYRKDNKKEILYTVEKYGYFFISDDGRSLVVLTGHNGSPQKDHIGISFYYDGKVIKEYSTLEIAENEDNVERSAVGYSEVKSVEIDGKYFFLQRIDGGWIKFDISTGAIISKDPILGKVGK
jgi:hypothetical protein